MIYDVIVTVLCVGGWSAFGVYFWKNQGHKKFMSWANQTIDGFQGKVDQWQGQK